MADSLHYRGAGGQYGAFATDDMEIMDDGPVYRSLGGGLDDDDLLGEAPQMPGMCRQAAFGGALGLGDIFEM